MRDNRYVLDKPFRIGLDARLESGSSGGVEQMILGLAAGLASLTDGHEEYYFLAYENSADWLRPYLGDRSQLLIDGLHPQKHQPGWRRTVASIPGARALWGRAPQFGPLRPKVPRSSGRIEGAGMDVMHFTTQSGFLTSVPSIYHPHDLQHLHLPEYFTPRVRVTRETQYRALCAQAKLVAVASRWVKQDLVAQYNLSPEKIRVIPLAPPVQAYAQPSRAERDRARSRFVLPEAFLFYPAQTWPHKNHIALLRALSLLRERQGLRIPLVCSGRATPHLRWIEAVARELRVEDAVQFLGFVSPLKLQCLYAECRAVVVPTLFEAGSFPVMEAFSIGAPVACSNVTSLPEQAGDAALLFEPTDPEQIADAVRRLWTDTGLRETLVARGYDRIRTFTWERSARAFRGHYRWIGNRDLNEEDRYLVATSV